MYTLQTIDWDKNVIDAITIPSDNIDTACDYALKIWENSNKQNDMRIVCSNGEIVWYRGFVHSLFGDS